MRVDRLDCEYPKKSATAQRTRALSPRAVDEALNTTNSTSISDPEEAPLNLPAPPSGLSSAGPDATQPWIPFNIEPPQVSGTVLQDDSFFLDDSLFLLSDTFTPSFGP